MKKYFIPGYTGLEIDFVIRYKGECMLVEVKATGGNIKSAKTILNSSDKYHINSAIKLGDYNIDSNDKILTLASYMAFLLRSR